MKTRTKLIMALLVVMFASMVLATALEQFWVEWTYEYVENGQLYKYTYYRLAPQPCSEDNLACEKLKDMGLWNT